MLARLTLSIYILENFAGNPLKIIDSLEPEIPQIKIHLCIKYLKMNTLADSKV